MNAFNGFFRRIGRELKVQSVLSVVCLSGLSSAALATDIPEAYHLAADLHGVPPEILYAVALNESQVQLDHGVRPWPWTLNIAGKGYHFETRDEACEALFRALFETEVIDVGIAQLNIRWQPQLFGADNRFVHHCDALDPYANLEEAARLLRQHYDNSGSGDWIIAAGRYHRPAGGAPAARYRRAVAANLAQLNAPIGSTAQSIKTPKTNVLFALAEDVGGLPSDANASASVNSIPGPRSESQQVVSVDHSLTWVDPSELDLTLNSWVDPHVHWFTMVAAK